MSFYFYFFVKIQRCKPTRVNWVFFIVLHLIRNIKKLGLRYKKNLDSNIKKKNPLPVKNKVRKGWLSWLKRIRAAGSYANKKKKKKSLNLLCNLESYDCCDLIVDSKFKQKATSIIF